ncbi:hypothetical protein HanIR_Chr16g0825411 [Helianthus annuus]|nr:hypothetical protein HanIR_Chr16g0825411 [Helianthus annuus]
MTIHGVLSRGPSKLWLTVLGTRCLRLITVPVIITTIVATRITTTVTAIIGWLTVGKEGLRLLVLGKSRADVIP